MTNPTSDPMADPTRYKRGSAAWMFQRAWLRHEALHLPTADARVAAMNRLDRDFPPLCIFTHLRRTPR